ncbi:MAG TPA: hypothetical protein VJ385_06060 [Fibrobacteria bacterium]|nr:hypothetical protein [Fibrobacteria bacterium]
MRYATAAFCGLALMGCLKPDQPALLATATAPRAAPDCAGCHAYPLHDVNHNYHLRSYNTREGIQGGGDGPFFTERPTGIIVCMDCHFGSIAHRNYSYTDTVWDSGLGGRLPTDTILRIDTIPGFLPLPSGKPTATVSAPEVDSLMVSAFRIGDVVRWLTAANHMNGIVDVEFNPNFVTNYANDTTISKSAYHPRDMSCSAIECHNAPKKTYRWASKSLGLIGCPTLDSEHSPAIDTSCRYSPKQEPK